MTGGLKTTDEEYTGNLGNIKQARNTKGSLRESNSQELHNWSNVLEKGETQVGKKEDNTQGND